MASKTCEMGSNSVACGDPATVYGGYAGADQWAGALCTCHSMSPGIHVWDRLKPEVEPNAGMIAAQSGTFDPSGEA